MDLFKILVVFLVSVVDDMNPDGFWQVQNSTEFEAESHEKNASCGALQGFIAKSRRNLVIWCK